MTLTAILRIKMNPLVWAKTLGRKWKALYLPLTPKLSDRLLIFYHRDGLCIRIAPAVLRTGLNLSQ